MTTSNDCEDRLRRVVEHLAGTIGPRHLGKPETMTQTREFIEQELARLGWSVRRETYEADGLPVSNLIVERIGKRSPERVLIVGAHYDTIPQTPGADDNASAVAVLLELARMLAQDQFQYTLRMIFFACEEMPYFHQQEMGSQVHSHYCKKQNEQLVGMFSLEMLGYYTSGPGSQKLPPGIPKWLHWIFPREGNFLAAVANPRSINLLWQFRRGFKRGSSFPLFTVPLPETIREIRLSDHSNFWDQGFPALMLTDTSFLRNPHYHQPTDTPETLDYPRMAEVTQGICSAIRFLVRREIK